MENFIIFLIMHLLLSKPKDALQQGLFSPTTTSLYVAQFVLCNAMSLAIRTFSRDNFHRAYKYAEREASFITLCAEVSLAKTQEVCSLDGTPC